MSNNDVDKTKEAKRRNAAKVLHHYTAGTNQCSICDGEVSLGSFCLVAVSDTAKELRRKHSSRLGARFYSTVVRLEFPQGFMVTCQACVNPRRGPASESTTEFQAREALVAAGFGPDGSSAAR